MTGSTHGRDGEPDAFIVDRYLDALLDRRPADTTGLPAELQLTAERLARGLPRYHPSFRFEEYLAARLAAVASGRAGDLVAFPAAPRRGYGAVAGDLPTIVDNWIRPVRPVVLGGVLTSAAISLAGAAFVAWRRSRPTMDPMARAVRAVGRGRA